MRTALLIVAAICFLGFGSEGVAQTAPAQGNPGASQGNAAPPAGGGAVQGSAVSVTGGGRSPDGATSVRQQPEALYQGFADLRHQRAAMRTEISHLVDRLSALRQEIDRTSDALSAHVSRREMLRDSMNLLEEQRTNQIQQKSFFAQRASELEQMLGSLSPQDHERSSFTTHGISLARAGIAASEAQIARLDQERQSIQQSLEEEERKIRENANTRAEQIQNLDSLEPALSQLYDRLQAIESQIDEQLLPQLADRAATRQTESENNSFKLMITSAFSGLVGVVIVGFFTIAWRDIEVRRAIFSGQSGIQFLTLFSIVISIILFGITEILEGKELAALLGGLSGYILGRVTNETPGSAPSSAAAVAPPGPSVTPANPALPGPSL